MKTVKFIVKPLKVTATKVFMTPEQIEANSSLLVNDPATAGQTCFYELKDGRTVRSVVDYDDKLFLTTDQLQDTLWQAIRGFETFTNGRKDLLGDCEKNVAKAFSVHNAVLKQNCPKADLSFSSYIAKSEKMSILLRLMKDNELLQQRLKECDEADKQCKHSEWLDVFGEKNTKERLGIILERGGKFLFLDAITGDPLRQPHLFYQAVTSSLYASKLKGNSLAQAVEYVTRNSIFPGRR